MRCLLRNHDTEFYRKLFMDIFHAHPEPYSTSFYWQAFLDWLVNLIFFVLIYTVLNNRVRPGDFSHPAGLPAHRQLPPNLCLHTRPHMRSGTLRLARAAAGLLPPRQAVSKDRSCK